MANGDSPSPSTPTVLERSLLEENDALRRAVTLMHRRAQAREGWWQGLQKTIQGLTNQVRHLEESKDRQNDWWATECARLEAELRAAIQAPRRRHFFARVFG